MKAIRVTDDSVAPLIDRAYRESGPSQYVRELVQNALEATATQVEIGPEWQAAERSGVWRFMIADNGRGMTPEQLEAYLGSFGAGGRSIGGLHENFGIGSKTSTLPWNYRGVVILSYTTECPGGAMLWLEYDAQSNQYGMKELTDDGDVVATPFDGTDDPDVLGIDWSTVAPEWVREKQGTVVVLLGNTGRENTLWGKKGDDALRSIRKYVNTRYWKLPEDVTIRVTELHGIDDLPKSRHEAFTRRGDGWQKANVIAARGAGDFAEQDLKASDCVTLKDGTKVHWFLKNKKPSEGGGARFPHGFVATLYKNELYNVTRQGAGRVFRAWGISHTNVYERLVLVVEPSPANKGKGVFPSQARAGLLMQSGDEAVELPWDDWREEFRERLPEEIARELVEASRQAKTSSNERLKELERRIRERYKQAARVTHEDGDDSVDTGCGAGPQGANRKRSRPHASRQNTGVLRGPRPARMTDNGTTSIPDVEWCSADEMGEDQQHMGAVWNEPGQVHPRGLIMANEDFGPLASLVKDLQKLWHASYEERIEEVVREEIAVAMQAKVAEFRSALPESDKRWKAHDVREQLQNSSLLTFAMVGFAHEYDAIKRKLTDELGKPRHLKVA